MALVRKCDFCGNTYPFNPYLRITTIVESRMYVDRKYDMCAECELKLKEFMIGLRTVKENHNDQTGSR